MPDSAVVRADGRGPKDLRPVKFERGFSRSAVGSCLASFGSTRVLCTVSVQDGVPEWMRGQGRGWLTAEYAMLPSSTNTRKVRDRAGKVDGRSVEIQRLIGRVLRATLDPKRLGERTWTLDCDVLDADGGTRTCAITGAGVALDEAVRALRDRGELGDDPRIARLAAVSVGVVQGAVLVDLDYREDHRAEADMNLVMDSAGRFLEVQASAEGRPFTRTALGEALDAGSEAIRLLLAAQECRP